MADNDEKIIKALEALQADVTTIKTEHGKKLDEQGKQIATLTTTQQKQGKQLDTLTSTVNHIDTGLEALAAGQKEIKETMATKADVLQVGVKVDKMRKRIENLEDATSTTDPHKN